MSLPVSCWYCRRREPGRVVVVACSEHRPEALMAEAESRRLDRLLGDAARARHRGAATQSVALRLPDRMWLVIRQQARSRHVTVDRLVSEVVEVWLADQVAS